MRGQAGLDVLDSGPMSTTPAGWTHRALLTPRVRRLALLAMLISAVFPIAGLGVDLCPVHRATGLPCPGCGLTRAISALTQGDLATAAGLNPFAFLAWPVLVVLALLALAPAPVVGRVERRLDAHGPVLTRAFTVVLAALLGFGALRLVAHLLSGVGFP